MKSLSLFTFCVLLCAGILLAGCGTLQITIENNHYTATAPTETVDPTASSVMPTLTAEPSPTTSAPTNTPNEPDASNPSGNILAAVSGQSIKITSLTMIGALNGWGVGLINNSPDDHIFYTTDGGKTWLDRTPPVTINSLTDNSLAVDAYFASPARAWVIYSLRNPGPPSQDLVIWTTTDSGKTWQPSDPLDLTNVNAEFTVPSNLGFSDDHHGWLLVHLGVGMSHDYISIFTTTNSGQTWDRVVDPTSGGDLMVCPKTGLAFLDGQNGWLTGDCPGLMDHLFFYHTTDGGHTWNQADLPPSAAQAKDLFAQGQSGCGIPEIVMAHGRNIMLNMRCNFYDTGQPLAWLYSSLDGGQTWTPRIMPTPFSEVSFTDLLHGWLNGTFRDDPTASAEIFATQDAGQTWFSVLPVGWQGAPQFVDPLTGWVIARQSNDLALVKTTTGGKTWIQIQPVVGK